MQYKRLNRDKEIIFFIYDLLVLTIFLKTEIAALTPFVCYRWFPRYAEFVARLMFACYQRGSVKPNFRIRLGWNWEFAIPTAEKIRNEYVPFLCVTSCRWATMRVANSRLLMLPNSCVPLVASDHRSSAEIRQNQGSAPNCNLAVHKELLIFYIFEDMKPISSFVSTNYTCAIVLYGMSICPSASSASFFWGEHSGREFEPFCFCIINIKCRISLIIGIFT